MRVLIVTQYFWPESFRINDLAAGLRDRGHDVTVLTGLPNYPEGRLFPGYRPWSTGETHDGIRILRVPLLTRGRSKGPRLVANYLSFALSASVLGPLRCRQPFDAIFVYEPSPITVMLPAIVLRRLRNVPVLLWVQDLWPESLSATGTVRSPWVLRQIERFVRFAYRQCERVLVQSAAFVQQVRQQGVPAERIDYYPNWAETFYQPVTLEDDAPEHQELPRGFRIVFAGNIGSSQSFDTILAAAENTRHLPEIQWAIIGDGREKEWVAAEVARRGLQATVHLLGRRPAETMPRYFAAADALLVTLKRDPIFSLTIPSKLQTYLACGRPVLAAIDGEGARVVEEAGAGLACPAEDAVGLARIAEELYRSGVAARQAMGRRGLDYCRRHFDRDALLDRLEAMLNELVSGAAPAARIAA